MVIVEGPDGSGKSTLVKTLAEVTGLPVAPRVVSKDTQAMVDLKTWTEENVAQGFQAMIFDRHRLISEPIYGSILRTQFEPGFQGVEWLYNMNYMLYHNCRPIIIYCLPPYDVVQLNIRGDENNKVVAPKIRKIYSLYVNKVAQDMVLYDRAIKYDYSNDTYKGSIFKAIRDQIERSLDV